MNKAEILDFWKKTAPPPSLGNAEALALAERLRAGLARMRRQRKPQRKPADTQTEGRGKRCQ